MGLKNDVALSSVKIFEVPSSGILMSHRMKSRVPLTEYACS